MILERRAAPPFYKNGYLLAPAEGSAAVLIDPGDEVDDLLEIVAARSLHVKYILLTHGHVDHVSGVERARAATGAPVGLHRKDLFLYEAATEQGRFFGIDVQQPTAPDFFIEDGQHFEWDGMTATVLHTPGHSPGGVCFLVSPINNGREIIFAGDTLFASSIGRTDLPGGDYDVLIRSIQTVLLTRDDTLTVYPGHGGETTIGDERRTNPFLTPPR